MRCMMRANACEGEREDEGSRGRATEGVWSLAGQCMEQDVFRQTTDRTDRTTNWTIDQTTNQTTDRTIDRTTDQTAHRTTGPYHRPGHIDWDH